MKKVNAETMTAEINLKENAVYIVKDGELTNLPKPVTGYGSHTFLIEFEISVNWQGGKPCHGKMVHDLRF